MRVCMRVRAQAQENVQQRSMTCVCVRAQVQENVQQKTLLAHPTHPVDTHIMMQNVTTFVSLSETRHQKQVMWNFSKIDLEWKNMHRVPHLKRQRLTLGPRANIDVKSHGFPGEMVYIHGDSSTSI